MFKIIWDCIPIYQLYLSVITISNRQRIELCHYIFSFIYIKLFDLWKKNDYEILRANFFANVAIITFFAITSVKIPDRWFYSTFTCLTVTMTSWNCDVIDMFRILAVGMLCLHVTFVTVVLIRHQTFEAW